MASKPTDRLTPQQEKLIQVYHDKYLKIGLATHQTPNKKETEAAITELYAHVKQPKPKFIWCRSPQEAKNKIRKLDPNASTSTHFWGSMDVYWVAYYKYANEVLGVKYEEPYEHFLDLYETIGKNCGIWFAFEGYCFLSLLPTHIRLNLRNKLHSFDRPAIEYSDGYKIFAINGVKVPEYYVVTPKEEIDVKRVLKESNAEIRMAVLQKIGANKVFEALNATKIDSCQLSADKINDLCEITLENGHATRYLVVRWADKFNNKTTTLPVPCQKADFNQKWQEKYGKNWSGDANSARDVTYWTFGIPPGTPILQHT